MTIDRISHACWMGDHLPRCGGFNPFYETERYVIAEMEAYAESLGLTRMDLSGDFPSVKWLDMNEQADREQVYGPGCNITPSCRWLLRAIWYLRTPTTIKDDHAHA